MFWQDILVNKIVTKNQLVSSLVRLFEVSGEEILVTNSIANLNQDLKGIRILCETYKNEAEFPLRICIFLRDRMLIPICDVEVVGRLCELLRCEALISDESINPASMILVKGANLYDKVYIDIGFYDNGKNYDLS